MGALDGIRVLDFGRYVAGPYCATLLGDFGADVIRIERRGGGEDRFLGPVAESGDGAMFLQLGRNKRSITFNPRADGAAQLRSRLIETADVVVVNVPPQTLGKMGLDYETLTAIKPDIILASVSSFGPKGPWSDRPGFDSVGQAMSGAQYLTGNGDVPIRTPITWVDHATAVYSAFGVMMALFERQRTGKGQQVDSSLLGSALAYSSTSIIEEAMTAIGRKAIGNRSFLNGPTDTFATTDGWIVTQVVGNSLFKRWAGLMEEPHWLDDPRFASDTLRGENGELLSERTARWCETRTSQQALDELAAANIPAGPVLSPKQAMEHEQVAGMDFVAPTYVPHLGRDAPLTRPPVDLQANPATIRTPPPAIGEHNEQVLAELGYSAEEIAKMVSDGVV
ncbi:MAG: CoA transferase [Sphingomonadaceae bacterium]|nr:CoA transferase [Sphingomonadaceae bacterium]